MSEKSPSWVWGTKEIDNYIKADFMGNQKHRPDQICSMKYCELDSSSENATEADISKAIKIVEMIIETSFNWIPKLANNDKYILVAYNEVSYEHLKDGDFQEGCVVFNR